ncbi:6-phosphogluconolactonase [Dongia mobilis]|uniref:6-phosphogluconolactonase n=1 Tax=Dongia mobilis TaxID=578943 RepID=A0A4R6WRN7_9PROT|nr:6-phosphogluconolactonase [Dongia mobilis]TDQ84272.1 6-phosphogluconolactonase [Dongia mobilis]
MTVHERTFDSRDALAVALAARLAQILREAVAARGAASLVVPGGSTPVAVFDHLSRADIPWAKVTVIPCDERWVASDHPDSNEGLIRRHLLRDKADTAQACSLYRQLPSPADALPDIARALGAIPRPFDAVFLGMGEDGHIASLFPGRAETGPALRIDAALDLMVLTAPAKGHPRIGLTLRALTDTRHLFLAVPGAEKRVVLAQAMANIEKGDDRLPLTALLRQDRVPVEILTCI